MLPHCLAGREIGSEETGWAARGDPGSPSQCWEKTEVSNSDHPNTMKWSSSPPCAHDGALDGVHFDGPKLRCFGKAFRSLVYFSPGSLSGSGKDSDKIKENVIQAMDPR